MMALLDNSKKSLSSAQQVVCVRAWPAKSTRLPSSEPIDRASDSLCASDMDAYGKAVLRSPKVPRKEEAGWKEGEEHLINGPGDQFWSEHSERNL